MNVDSTFFIPTIAVVLWLMYRAWRGSRSAPEASRALRNPEAVTLDATPDVPVQFGYKVSWLAVRAGDPAAVAEAAGIGELEPANWQTGIDAAYRGYTFLSPPVNGWVLVVSFRLPDLGDQRTSWNAILEPLAKHFREVCYFGTHRVVGYQAWARFVDGNPTRVFGYLGERGEILVNEGPPTPEEAALDHQFSSLPAGPVEAESDDLDTDADADLPATPDEEDVLDVAGAWSVSTRDLPDLSPEPSRGWVSRTWPVA